MTVRAAVVGCSGYTGREAVRLLVGHPDAELVGVFASSRTAGQSMGAVFPELRGVCDLPVAEATLETVLACALDAVLLATPHEQSADLAGPLADAGVAVVDLSGAHRLGVDAYPAHYGFDHPNPDALRTAVYGQPETGRDGLDSAPIIAVAGCYVTAAVVPLAAVTRAGLLDGAHTPAITAISGVSGAGRPPKPHTAFCEVSAQPYGVLAHRHQPEIERVVARRVGFVPVLGPWDRGIVCTTHADLAAGVTADSVRTSLHDALAHEPFVRLLPDGEWPSVNATRGTNFIDIAVAVDEPTRRVVLCSALDNLLKGASGQAVQCMNIRFGLPETLALIPGDHHPAPSEAAT